MTHKIYISNRILLLIFVLLMIFPVIYLVIVSLTPTTEIFQTHFHLLPSHFTLEHYNVILREGNIGFFRNLINSTIITLSVTLITIIVGVMGGYSLARCNYKGREFISLSILAIYIVPQILLGIPMFSIMRSYGLIDTRIGLILAHLTLTLPFSIWILKNAFLTIPKELEDAAMIDGSSRLRVLWNIMVPISKPAIITIVFYTVIVSWCDYLYAFILTTKEEMRTLPLGLNFIVGQETGYMGGPMLAYAVLTIVPPVIIFLIVQRNIIEGLTSGAIKG